MNCFNYEHPNKKFSIQHEGDNKINFLNWSVSEKYNKLVISVYRKPTFSDLDVVCFSFCGFRFKFNAIKTLLYRAYNVSSHCQVLHC